jgi:hypothetical protein
VVAATASKVSLMPSGSQACQLHENLPPFWPATGMPPGSRVALRNGSRLAP